MRPGFTAVLALAGIHLPPDRGTAPGGQKGRAGTVAAVSFAHGGDNIGRFVPVFLGRWMLSCHRVKVHMAGGFFTPEGEVMYTILVFSFRMC